MIMGEMKENLLYNDRIFFPKKKFGGCRNSVSGC